MVKKRVGGAHRYKSVQKGGSSQGLGQGQQKKHKQQQDAGPKPPSHLQRKITKSVKFYEKVLSQSAPKAPQGVRKRKKKPAKSIASLDSLSAELNDITAAAAAAAGGSSAADTQLTERQQARLLAQKGTESSIKRSKARLAMGVTESARLQRVLQHPAYKADPFQAVMNHLLNTLPAVPQQQQQQQQQGQQQQQHKKQKKKQGGGSSGADDMQH